MRSSTLVLALVTGWSQAQEGAEDEARDDANWYRVELLIFANNSIEAIQSERWPLLPELAYPDSVQELEEGPAQVAADRTLELVPLEQQLPPASELDLFWEYSKEELLQQYRIKQDYRRPAIELEPLFKLEVPTPYRPLDRSALEFSSQARSIDRNSELELLLHTAWLQPMRAREQSTPLLLDGLPQSGDYPRLQGSVLLYSARYLHLETRLWLNTDGAYLDTNWRMPAPPPPLQDETLQVSEFVVELPTDWLQLLQVPELSIEPGTEMSEQLRAEQMEQPGQPINTLGPISPDTDSAQSPMAETGPAWTREQVLDSLDEPEYNYRHAVLLEQRRRMRSGELHYIDHPMLGLVIRVSRYEFEPFVQEGLPSTLPGTP